MSELINTTKIGLNNLNNYCNDLPTGNSFTGFNSPSITNFLMLGSELRTEGLNALNNALNSETDIDKIRENYSQKLLKDVESLTKRADFQRAAKRNNDPKFKQEFYDESKKPAGEKSKDYMDFITSCSSIMKEIDGSRNDLTCTELISARMLVHLDEKQATTTTLKNKLTQDLKLYKEKSIAQTTADIGSVEEERGRKELKTTRNMIFFKDKQGNTKILNKENFSAEFSLSGEQEQFIFSMWSQGTFGGGWFMDAGEKFQMQLIENGGNIDLNNNGDFITIDISEKEKVIVRSRLTASIILDNQEYFNKNPNVKIDYTQGVLEVDISNMKGNTFTPGCSTAEPEINFYISEFSNNYRYDIPKNLKIIQSLEYDDIRKQMIEDKKRACIDEIINNGPSSVNALEGYLPELIGLDKETIEEFKKDNILEGLKVITVSEIQNLPQEAKIEILAVKCYEKIEHDLEKHLNFAKLKLEEYCKKQDIKYLDSKERQRIKTGIISILEPAIKDPNEKKSLDKNIDGAIRVWAREKNVSMSIKESLKRIIDFIFKSKEIREAMNKFKVEPIDKKFDKLSQSIKEPQKGFVQTIGQGHHNGQGQNLTR